VPLGLSVITATVVVRHAYSNRVSLSFGMHLPVEPEAAAAAAAAVVTDSMLPQLLVEGAMHVWFGASMAANCTA
jgi:hypothetical protein